MNTNPIFELVNDAYYYGSLILRLIVVTQHLAGPVNMQKWILPKNSHIMICQWWQHITGLLLEYLNFVSTLPPGFLSHKM